MLGAKKRDPFVAALRRLAKAGEAALLPAAAPPEVEPGSDLHVSKPPKTKKGAKAKSHGKKKQVADPVASEPLMEAEAATP